MYSHKQGNIFTPHSKYKGHTNENYPLRTNLSSNYEFIVSGSEDGYFYVWNKDPPEAALTYTSEITKMRKPRAFKPYWSTSVVSCTVFAKKPLLTEINKTLALQKATVIKEMLIVCTINGHIGIYYAI